MMFYIYGGILFCFWIYWLWTRRKYYALIWKITGPLGYPLVGMAPYLMKREEILSTFDKYIKKYGTFLLSWLGPYPFVVISDPILAQDILTSPHCINKGAPYDAIDRTLGKGLFSIKDPEWSIHRKYMNAAFKHQTLNNFIPIFNNEVDKLLKKIKRVSVNQKTIDLLPIIRKYTLVLSTKTTMGNNVLDDDSDEQISVNLLESFYCILRNLTEMCFTPWLKYDIVRYVCRKKKDYEIAKFTIQQFIQKLIKLKLLADEVKNDDEKTTFIDISLDLWKKGIFSQTNVEDECSSIVLGAFETTANTITHVLILLSMFSEYQEKIYEELVSMFPVRQNIYITYNNMQNLTYLDMIINESMRILTPVPIVCRQATQDVLLSNGTILPEGIQIAIDIFHMHRLKSVWGTKSHIFNPDNFLSNNTESRHPYAFMPFTKGIRNCIGWRYGLMSTKISLAKLLRNFKFTTDFKYEQLEFVEDITLKLKEMPKLRIYQREK